MAFRCSGVRVNSAFNRASDRAFMCVRAGVGACVRVCVRAFVGTCVSVCVCAFVLARVRVFACS